MNNINSIESDRELLELAAKAGGYSLSAVSDMIWSDAAVEYIPWNPLADDGDALRLTVKLNISINRPVEGDSEPHWGTYADTHDQRIQFKERDNGDPYAATRRAIVRAAAEIGRTT